MPFPPERKTIIIKQEAARRRFLAICERCFPEWTKRLTSEELEYLVAFFLQEMPPEICWLERGDGLKMGARLPPAAFDCEPLTDPQSSAEESQKTEPPRRAAERSTPLFSLVSIERQSYLPRVLGGAETVAKAALWLPRLLDGVDASPCRFCAETRDAKWLISAIERRHA